MKAFPRLRSVLVAVSFLVLVGLLGYRLELSFPVRSPSLENTLTPMTKPTAQEIGSYDVLGYVVSKADAEKRLQTEAGKAQLAAESGAIVITRDLIELGRDAFYRETFGNEYFFTDVMGVINGPINLITVGKAIAALGGKPTTNLQVTLDQDVTVGGRRFSAGTVLNTGLDVPAGALVPLGMQTFKSGATLRVGLTCALCHASVDQKTGKVIEGTANTDVDTGLLQAFATNSAAMFRQTGVKPAGLPVGDRTYINVAGQTATLPHAQALEDAVDAQFLAWPPGNFDSTPDNVNNPAQNPPSYTFETFPYGWSGFASVGWFHGLTTLNNNVHAVNSDPTTGTYTIKYLAGLDQETMLGVMLQNAANPKFRLPEGVKPSAFFEKGDPTPGEPGLNKVVKMPGFPRGSIFMVDGLMANSPGKPFAAQLNGMSAYQNTLAPPPYPQTSDRTTLERGAAIFTKANCAQCHSGRYFTNHEVVPIEEIQSEPSRAKALAKIPPTLISPETYPPNSAVPLPTAPAVLPVPTDITPDRDRQLAYAIHSNGGIKVQHLIGLYTTAPYLHDGGVAATATALEPGQDGYYSVAHPEEMGMAGTLMQNREPDAAASLRVLLDRTLRAIAIAQNRQNSDLQGTHVDGTGHEYWVDQAAGFSPEEQTALIEFLLAIDDDPDVLPASLLSTGLAMP